MSYPLTSQVSAGDATLASHYNNLRSDALFLGQSVADAVNLAAFLERFESRLTIERLNTDQLRVPASASEPVSLMISGYMVQAVADVDLAAEQKPSGAENTYYIFANRADDSTTFTLTVSTVSTEGENQRRIGRFYWDGSKIVKDSVRTEFSVQLRNLLYYVEPQICEGRLTVSTGVSVPAADVSASSNVYFTPHTGNRIALYVPNYGWRLYTFSELILDISAVPTDTNLDVWIYDNAGTLTLDYTAWSNNTLRATAIVRQDGIYCKSGALNYRYLGTVHTCDAGETADTKTQRLVWNYYNRVSRPFYLHDDSGSWTYSERVWRPWNNSTDNRVELVVGVDESVVDLEFHSGCASTAEIIRSVGIGLDSTSIASEDSIWCGFANPQHSDAHACFHGYPGLGFHYFQFLELGYSSTYVTYYGTYSLNGVELHHSGAFGSIMS